MTSTLRTLTLGLGFTLFGAGLAVAGQSLAESNAPPATPCPCAGLGGGMGPGPGLGMGPGMGHGHGRGPGGFLGPVARVFDDLDLTAAQTAIVEKAHDDLRTLGESHREEMSGLRDRLRAALAGPKADAKALHALADERIEARSTMIHAVVDDFTAVWNSLDDKQRAVVLDRLDRIQERRRSDEDAR
jgi:periplasmic protein CpxP/Spy